MIWLNPLNIAEDPEPVQAPKPSINITSAHHLQIPLCRFNPVFQFLHQIPSMKHNFFNISQYLDGLKRICDD